MNSVDNIERHATSTALSFGAAALIAIGGGFGYWMLQRTNVYWEKALAASLGALGSLGAASYLESTATRVRARYSMIQDMSEQIEVQQTWMESNKVQEHKPPMVQKTEEQELSTLAKPEGLPEITWNDVLKNYINKPERYPHLGVFGSTGAGKTLLAEALGDARAAYYAAKGHEPRQVYLSPICDRTNLEFQGWELVGDGFDTDQLQEFGEQLQETLYARYRGEEGEPLIVATDEYRWTAKNTKGTSDIIGDVLSIGRKRQLEIILLAQSYLVKTLKMEGEGQLREQLVMFLKGGLALDRIGVLERNGIFPKGSTVYLTKLFDAYPYNICLCDDKVLILPDMSGYRKQKTEMGIGYMDTPITLSDITPPTVLGVQKKGGGRRKV